jgi:hypothetical protein
VQESLCANPAVATFLIGAVIVGDTIFMSLLSNDFGSSLGLDSSGVPGSSLKLYWGKDVDVVGGHCLSSLVVLLIPKVYTATHTKRKPKRKLFQTIF